MGDGIGLELPVSKVRTAFVWSQAWRAVWEARGREGARGRRSEFGLMSESGAFFAVHGACGDAKHGAKVRTLSVVVIVGHVDKKQVSAGLK